MSEGGTVSKGETVFERLNDKRVLVVGASVGIGRAVAAGAAAAGVRVVATARRADKLAELDAVTIAGDVTDDADCERFVTGAVDELGGLDGVVYTVGASPLLPIAEATGDDWHRVFATNVIGTALVLTKAAPHLLESNGRAVVLSSKAVSDPFPDLSLYTTSKIALDGLLRCLDRRVSRTPAHPGGGGQHPRNGVRDGMGPRDPARPPPSGGPRRACWAPVRTDARRPGRRIGASSPSPARPSSPTCPRDRPRDRRRLSSRLTSTRARVLNLGRHRPGLH